MNIASEAIGFQQTQSTRVKDMGPAVDANPPPPPKEAQPEVAPTIVDAPSPHPARGQNLNTSA